MGATRATQSRADEPAWLCHAGPTANVHAARVGAHVQAAAAGPAHLNCCQRCVAPCTIVSAGAPGSTLLQLRLVSARACVREPRRRKVCCACMAP
jgi:hypothetical protein